MQDAELQRYPSASSAVSQEPNTPAGPSRATSTTRVLQQEDRSSSLSKDPTYKRARRPSLSRDEQGSSQNILATVLSRVSQFASTEAGRTTGRQGVLEDGIAPAVSKRTAWRLSQDKAQLAVAFALIASVGANDSATGALLDAMRVHYAVSYDEVSLVFLAIVAGYFVSCLVNSHLLNWLGMRYNLIVACVFVSLGSVLLVLAPPFPVFIIALSFLGFGEGVYDSSLTTLVSHQDNGSLMSVMYAGFAVGACLAPLIIGALLDHDVAWNKYYYAPLALAVGFTAIAFPVFAGYSQPTDESVQPSAQPGGATEASSSIELAPVGAALGRRRTGDRDEVESSTSRSAGAASAMKKVLKIKVIYLGFILIFLSFSLTDVFSSWIVSFLLEKRHAPESSSRYQLAGLWGGIGLGRATLAVLSSKMSEKAFSISLLFLTCVCLALIWAIHQIALSAVMICVAGFFLGPLTPKVLSSVAARVPPSLKSPAMSLTIGAGLFGSAFAPLLFGLVAQAGYLSSLPGVLIGTAATSGGVWLFVPRHTRRED